MNSLVIKSKKILPLISIVCVVLAALIGIAGIIKSDLFNLVFIPKILLSLLIVFLASLCLLNTLDGLLKRNKLSFLTFFLVLLSSLLFFVMVWVSFNETIQPIYTKVVVILALLTIFFDLVISNHIILGRRMFLFQTIFYVILGVFEGIIAYMVLTGKTLPGITKYLVILAIVGIVLYIVLRIKVKSTKVDEEAEKMAAPDSISIPKEEYDALVQENEKLKALLKENNIQF